MSANFSSAADAILHDVTTANPRVPGVVAMATDRQQNIYEGAAGKRRIGQDADAEIELAEKEVVADGVVGADTVAVVGVVEDSGFDDDVAGVGGDGGVGFVGAVGFDDRNWPAGGWCRQALRQSYDSLGLSRARDRRKHCRRPPAAGTHRSVSDRPVAAIFRQVGKPRESCS